MNKSVLNEKIAQLVREKIEGIRDIRDELIEKV